MGFLKYITLGFEVINAVTTIAVMVKNPALLDAQAVQNVLDPVIAEIGSVVGVKINKEIADQVIADAVHSLKAILIKGQ